MTSRERVRNRYASLAFTCDELSLSCGDPFSMVDLRPGVGCWISDREKVVMSWCPPKESGPKAWCGALT